MVSPPNLLRIRICWLTDIIGGCGVKFCWKCKAIFTRKNNAEAYNSWVYKHFPGCPMIGGRYETAGTVERPSRVDKKYRDGYDADPGYESGTSDTEKWL
jgi:hypothetical protein